MSGQGTGRNARKGMRARLGGALRPTENNKYVLALIAAVTGVISAVAAIVLAPGGQPAPPPAGDTAPPVVITGDGAADGAVSGEWIAAADAVCARAERKIATAWAPTKDLPKTLPSGLGDRPSDELYRYLEISAGAFQGVAAAANAAANELAATPPPAAARAQLNASIDRLNAGSNKIQALGVALENARDADPATMLLLLPRLQEAEGVIAELKTAFQSLAVLGPRACATVIE
ncbi:hypothetical protein HNP84_009120 [Thermocatellispora tengchongensis]|uniref:Uncharacterized protein n=1 Tax=Thermocatellispora tengchongensis TaxID=1073253 RepID=A0A840PQJ6_9ACTN|nr:hypothetical protein [Thermocatellispora tengchongensis]MBB5139357.1 hypothetical protein [Thermocatellispora tengchongensis]